MKVKLTKIESNHQNLRSKEIIGNAPFKPQIGNHFVMYAESLTPGLDMRQIVTTEITGVSTEGKITTFSTQNSIYTVEDLDGDDYSGES